METKRYRDSANVYLHLELTKAEIKRLRKVDSLAVKLMMRNIDEETLNYQHFVTSTYNSATLLKSWIKAEREYADREMKRKYEELALRTESINWLISGNDSIPLNTLRKSKFKPVLVDSKYTVGILFSDSLNGEGYFYNITPSRKPTIKARFALDKPNLKERVLHLTKAQITSDPGENVFFILLWLDKTVKDQYPATLAKIYRSDGLSWNTNLMLPFVPEAMQFRPDTGDLLVMAGEDKTLLIDKAGKVK